MLAQIIFNISIGLILIIFGGNSTKIYLDREFENDGNKLYNLVYLLKSISAIIVGLAICLQIVDIYTILLK